MTKANRMFFAHGDLGAFHGSRSLVVIPVLMYGAEFWSLNSTLFSKLESFQAQLQLGKRILKGCPVENCAYVLLANSSLSKHFLSSYTNISTDLHSLTDSTSCQSDVFF